MPWNWRWKPPRRIASGTIAIDLAIAEESIQERAVLYDKQGDAHFDTISAFIKSLRGSDADAALFWLARMVEAGENPRFIFRRMLISAGEDIGLADPQAMVVVEACAAAFDRVGLPEGLYPLAHAALYLAGTEKSNSSLGFFDALRTVRQANRQQVPSPPSGCQPGWQGLRRWRGLPLSPCLRRTLGGPAVPAHRPAGGSVLATGGPGLGREAETAPAAAPGRPTGGRGRNGP